MPALLLLGIPLVFTTGSTFWRDVTGQNNSSGPNLVTLAMLAGAAYVGYRLLKKRG